jgi:hypothetical protein
MRKRLLFLVTVLAVVLLGGYLLLWLTAPRHRITLESFEQIKAGMTETEVEIVLGQVGDESPVGSVHPGIKRFLEQIRRSGVPDIRRVSYGPGYGSEDIARWKTWLGENCCILAGFNEQGKLIDKHITLRAGEESLLAKLRRWVGL